jgi:transcriptional regulator with GAF, ATPase, and Fis domain
VGHPDLPARYEAIEPLGKGGGGEVWAVRDRVTGRSLAWKTLGERASLDETRALVREATALGGLDGLGSPRVVAFGQTPTTRRPFLVRELVTGESLASLLSRGESAAPIALRAVLQAAEKLTVLHRAQLLHGDVKPANIIVAPDGTATWVDLGLVTPLVEGGVRPLGLTVLYAAPELLGGGALTVRAEVFALGATLRDVALLAKLDPPARAKLDELVARATSSRPEERFPSVDELAEELRPLVLGPLPKPDSRAAWPILGLDATASELQEKVLALPRSGALALTGERGGGRTTLLERLAFTLAISGESTAFIGGPEGTDRTRVIELELAGRDPASCFIFVDDAGGLSSAAWDELSRFRERGSRIVFVAEAEVELRGATCVVFAMPPLARDVVRELTLRAIPSLGEAALREVEARAGGSPAKLRAIVLRLAQQPVVDREDVVRILESEGAEPATASAASLRSLLERGHFDRAWDELARIPDPDDPEVVVLRARLLLNRGDWRGAVEALDAAPPPPGAVDLAAEAAVERSRAWLRGGEYVRSQEAASSGLEALGDPPSPREAHARVELSSTIGLCRSFSADHAGAREWLLRAVEEAAPLADPRSMSIAKGSLAFALQRAGDLEAAARTYTEALSFAELAGDAGAVATTRLNLAGVSKAMGDVAAALEHLGAAVDMGKKSGRRATLRQALLNLANLDLYLGRLARARASIDELAAERHELPPHFAAQLDALVAEHAAKSGRTAEAVLHCDSCAAAYLAMGRPVDSAEALLESCFAILNAPGASAELRQSLQRRLHEAEALLSNTQAHRPALDLARALVAREAGASGSAKLFDDAVQSAEASGKREWLAKAYAARADVREHEGQRLLARKDREAALLVFEEISAKLPRDLREVFWDEPSRRRLRDAADSALSVHTSAQSVHVGPRPSGTSHEGRSLREDRLARILDINREIAGTYDLSKLLDRVTDHAIQLLSAERGFVLLRSAREGSRPGEFSVHASRDQAGADVHARFSQSIAERVVSTGEPFVTTSARDDARMADYVSVHQLMLQSIACVPIRARSKGVIGALYVETRLSTAARFGEELAVLGALADQVGIAIETARLVSENERRAEELESANKDLTAARARLEELLGHRTAQLQATRRDLKSARAVIKSHFGYQGLVGTSEAQRKLYALIDRIKDTDVPVLITGESGTGKEVVARAIHNASPRAKQPFLGLNCGAIPEHLLESELFGHVRGAFTGADRDRRGLFREATDGTLLLDEIGEMPPKMQAGLLRVLQEKVVRPVGGAREESVETRVIAATHRDLEGMVQRGTFREDLFYRLNVIQVRVPPLRERVDDIPVLIDHFLGIFAARYHRDRRSVSRPALKMLMAHRWPGNVRQLENALLNAWVLSEGPELMPEDFELTESTGAVAPRPHAEPTDKQAPTSLDLHRASERDRILEALSNSNWNRVRAAELIGMPRRTFYRRLKEYGIQ